MNFEELGLNDRLLSKIKRLGFKEPTGIQEKTIPKIIKGMDVIGESATGSGKTLAFGCGILEQVRGKGLQALVLTPTRELAEQIRKALHELTDEFMITSVYGGVGIEPQINALRKASVVIATPGRLLDHLERGTVDLSGIKILVMDEADRMLDMGFIDDVEKIIRACPRERQTMFFSATISPRIEDLGQRYMNNPVKILAKKMVDPTKLEQVYYNVSKGMKLSLLAHLLKKEENNLAMVFCNTRRSVEYVAKNLRANKVDAVAIHGGMAQNKRQKIIDLFNKGKASVLIATDVAARGIHIDNVSHIYNYEIPNDSVDYVHRIGRTARAGLSGKAVNLVCDRDYDGFSRVFSDYAEFKIKEVDKPRVEKIETSNERSGFARGRRPDSRGYSRGRSSDSRGNTRGRSQRHSSVKKHERNNRGKTSRPRNSRGPRSDSHRKPRDKEPRRYNI